MKTRPTMRTLTGGAAYDELTAYLSTDDLANLEKGLAALPATLDNDKELVEKIHNGSWQEIFSVNNPDRAHFPFQALRCLRAGLISNMTFCTSQMFYNIFTHPDHAKKKIRVESIFNAKGDKRNPNSCSMIDATMRVFSSSHRVYLEQQKKEQAERALMLNQTIGPGFAAILSLVGMSSSTYDTSAWDDPIKRAISEWDTESKERFYTLLAALPASEKKFLVLPDPHFDGKSFTSENSVMKQINFEVGFNVFSRFRIKNKPDSEDLTPVCMIPTRGMMQAFLEATRPNSTPMAVYRFGLSPNSGLFQTMKSGGRDMYQTFAALAHLIPQEVDGYPALPSYAGPELHDFYHQGTASNVPDPDKKIFTDIAEYFFDLAKTDPACANYADKFAAEISDMELGAYNPNHTRKDPSKTELFSKPFYKFWRALRRTEPQPKSKWSTDEQIKFSKERFVLIGYFISYLLRKENEFEKISGLTLESLMKFESDDKDEFLEHVKRGLRNYVNEQMTSKNISELSFMLEAKPPVGRLLQDAIKNEINKLFKDDLITSAQIAHRNHSMLLKSQAAEVIGQYFKTFSADGTLAKLKNVNSEAFESIMSLLRETEQGNELLHEAVKNYEDRPEMFNMLYEKRFVNRSSRAGDTLIYQAVTEMNVELLLRLTNDGAVIAQPAESKKPSPFEKAAKLKCKDIQALLILAHKSGSGWVDVSPTCVERLRRLNQHRLSDKNNNHDARIERDIKWMNELLCKTPSELQKREDRNTGTQNRNTLFAASGRQELLSFMISKLASEEGFSFN